MWVVKLGGSLYESPNLPLWLKQLATFNAGQAVVVPGGGPFADQVRQAQNRWGISDACAHDMALLAMEQFGRLLLGLEPRLCSATTLTEVRQVLNQQRVAVWLPTIELLNYPGIPESWEVTSDSLAAWFSGKIKANRLILVKKAQLRRPVISAHALTTQGIVDFAFPRFLRAAGVPCYCISANDYAQVTQNSLPKDRTRVSLA